MEVLISYDLEEKATQVSKHSAVKQGMKDLGYRDCFLGTKNGKQETYYLPNTTLWKKEGIPSVAKADILKVAQSVGATVERLIATQFSPWDAIPGKPYAK